MRRIIVGTGCEMQILAMMKLQVPHKIKLLSLTTPFLNCLIVPQLYAEKGLAAIRGRTATFDALP